MILVRQPTGGKMFVFTIDDFYFKERNCTGFMREPTAWKWKPRRGDRTRNPNKSGGISAIGRSYLECIKLIEQLEKTK